MRRALLLTLLLAGPARAFDATGEILFSLGGAGSSAAFDADRVVGPNVNLSRMEGGAWSGDIRGQSLALEVSAERLAAPNFEIYLKQSKDKLVIRGNVFGRRYNLEYGPKGLEGKVGFCSVDLERHKTGALVGKMGCMREGLMPLVTSTSMKLVGRAGDPAPPMPQFALALIAIFP